MPNYFPTEDTHLNIARGLVKGTSVRNIFGYNPTIPTTAFVPAWELDEPYTFPNDQVAMSVVSSSSSDTNVSVLILGLDINFNEVSQVVSLTGTTPVVTQTLFYRINDVVTVAGNAVGDVTISNSGTIYARMRAGEGRNQASIYTVPAGHSFLLTRIDAFASSGNNPKSCYFRNFLTLNDGQSDGVNLRVAETLFLTNMHIMRASPFKYSEKTDIQLQLRADSSESYGSIFAEGILIKEGLG